MKFLIIMIFYYLFLTNCYAENKIIFLDIDYIYNNANAIKNIENEYFEKEKKFKNEISKLETEIRNAENILKNKQNIISEDIMKSEFIELESKVDEFNKIVSNRKEQLVNIKKKINDEFYKNLIIILENYANENLIDMIINKEQILVGKIKLDATNEILNEFNNNIKTISINE